MSMRMDGETQVRVKETVIEILKNADMEVMTEFHVRNLASQNLGFDLSISSAHKLFVRRLVESFLLSMPMPMPIEQEEQPSGPSQTIQQESQEQQETKPRILNVKEGRLICLLSRSRKVNIEHVQVGNPPLVAFWQFYMKDGRQFPAAKGISLTKERWESLRNAIPEIEEAIKKMEARLGLATSLPPQG